MLALSRHPGESLRLRNQNTGEIIEVLLVRTGTNRATIGIDAQRHWDIVREELLPERPTRRPIAG